MKNPTPIYEDYIDSIFNYCFRWCDRCPFTALCQNYQLEQEFAAELGEPRTPSGAPRNFHHLRGPFSLVLQRLRRQIRPHRPDWHDFAYGVEKVDIEQPCIDREDLASFARDLAVDLMQCTDQWNDGLKEDYNQPVYQALTELLWYSGMIATKTDRAASIFDDDAEPLEAIDYYDSNGSAKMAVLATVRAITATEVIVRELPGAMPKLLPLIEDLMQLQNALRGHFPDSAQFTRPGFDEPEYEEMLEQYYQGNPPINPYLDGTWTPRAHRRSDD